MGLEERERSQHMQTVLFEFVRMIDGIASGADKQNTKVKVKKFVFKVKGQTH